VYFSLTDAHIVVNGKGRKQREVGLGRSSRLALHRYIHEYRPDVPHNFVFVNRYGKHIQRPALEAILLKLQEKTGLYGLHVNPHKFRHTYAYMYMLTKQGDVLRLSRLLGHSSMTVTENYLKAFGSQESRDGSSVLDTLVSR
jgi:integrase/recombinase XerD